MPVAHHCKRRAPLASGSGIPRDTAPFNAAKAQFGARGSHSIRKISAAQSRSHVLSAFTDDAPQEQTIDCDQAVTLKFDDHTLVAFVIPAKVCAHQARACVETRLPYYCVPKVVLAMDELPKTPRGKLDKRLLLEKATRALAETRLEAAE